MEHFAFPGNVDFAAIFMFSSWKTYLFIHRLWNIFTSGESRAISNQTNDIEKQAQQVAAIPRRGRFSTETPLERERRLEIRREQRRRRGQQEIVSRENIA